MTLRRLKIRDILIVTITADKYVNKGTNRPYFNQNYRAEAISSLEFVDYVSIVDDKLLLAQLIALNQIITG